VVVVTVITDIYDHYVYLNMYFKYNGDTRCLLWASVLERDPVHTIFSCGEYE